MTFGTAKLFEFLFFHRIVCEVSQKFKERVSWHGREIQSVPEEPVEDDGSAGHISRDGPIQRTRYESVYRMMKREEAHQGIEM